ncbi:FAD:protein FMN transferase [Geodermatophilus sp. CPCC 206100]|uniref:FAD:protein FMN transferase n=1 Tax=Geodermatophilus sp. CPCC 206100 TaxID=3020054 RepID=UPI003AFFF468
MSDSHTPVGAGRATPAAASPVPRSAGRAGERRPARYTARALGRSIGLALRGRHAHDAEGRAAWTAALAVLRAADQVFSTDRFSSAVSRLGRGELALVDCPPEVAEVLALGAAVTRDSSGAFDVYRAGGLGEEVFDPSAVVPGWAAERAAAPLRALADTDFCLSVGGDLVWRTRDPAGPFGEPGARDRRDARQWGDEPPRRSGAVATSGPARGGRRVVDARTGQPASGIVAVTVVAATLTEACLDATAAHTLGHEAADWLRTRPGRTGRVAWTDGTTTTVRNGTAVRTSGVGVLSGAAT